MYKFKYNKFSHPLKDVDYKIEVAIPIAKEKGPFPVIYVLDGNAYGKLFQEVIQLQSRRPEKTGVKEMVVVSVGYDTDNLFPHTRVYDFTPPTSEPITDKKPDGTGWGNYGGANLFLDFLLNTVKPYVESLVKTDPLKQILFGHSLGGLLTTYTFFTRPDAFRHYIICSPSLWWHKKQVFKLKNESCQNRTKLIIAAERNHQKNMFKNAKFLSKKLKQSPNHQVLFLSPKGENHMSLVPTVISESLRFCAF